MRLYLEAMRPNPSLAEHIEFMLKHELVHLELFSRLFDKISGEEIVEWNRARPTSRYARRSGFFYEWITGRGLDCEGVSRGNYVDALDPTRYLTADPKDVPRWRVRNNLLGTRDFAPLAIRTENADAADRFNIAAAWETLQGEFGDDVLRRSAVWITTKESRSSFAIEHEGDQTDRIKRFASVIETLTGEYVDPLATKPLEEIQRAILGDRALDYGFRRSPIVVAGERLGEDVIHYIAPHWEDVPGMIQGLRHLLHKTTGLGPATRAALVSFGFVYIHPFPDGNGRTSRFLVNDVLRRDDAIAAPFVLPVSAVILREMRDYDRALERFSAPLMVRYRARYGFRKPSITSVSPRWDRYGFGRTDGIYPDGRTSTFYFDDYKDALHAWRFIDLTEHVEYMGRLIETTLATEMREEARYLVASRLAREGVKNVFEGPDLKIDRIIRSVRENGDTVSNKLRKEFPILDDPEVAEAVIEAVRSAFGGSTPNPS